LFNNSRADGAGESDGEVFMSIELTLKPEEAEVLVQFIEDSGIEYLGESCEDRGLDLEELMDKLVGIANSGQ